LPFAPIGSERYGMKNTFAVIEFAKPEAAGLFFFVFPFGPRSGLSKIFRIQKSVLAQKKFAF